jgi:hypothetical protein
VKDTLFYFFVPRPAAVIEVVYRRCCGIDVHKDFITACVLVWNVLEAAFA